MATYVPDPRAAVSQYDFVVVDRVHIGGRIVDFPRPLPGAPEYATVVAAEFKAEDFRAQLLSDLDERHEPPWQPNAPLVLDMWASGGTVVGTAMTGMEAFANHFILANEGSLTDSVDHAFNVPINERFSDLLPALLDKPKPTNAVWWPVFRRIQRLAVLFRHALYGPQEGKGLAGNKSLAERLYNGEYVGTAAMMVSAFEHFSPGWLSEERREALSSLSRTGQRQIDESRKDG